MPIPQTHFDDKMMQVQNLDQNLKQLETEVLKLNNSLKLEKEQKQLFKDENVKLRLELAEANKTIAELKLAQSQQQ